MGQLRQAVETLASFVRAVHIKRALHEVDPDPGLNFWRVIYGNLMDMAVIDWTKLFGSDDQQQHTHWKNVVPDKEHDDFREGLLRATGLSRAEWGRYWEEIKAYRDKMAAHQASSLDPELPSNFPHLDVALRAAYYYYHWLLERMRERGKAHLYPLDLEEYCERFSKKVQEAAQRAMAGTATMQEDVG